MTTANRAAGYLGRVLDEDGEPVGTCFQVAPGVLVTAWRVLAELDGAREQTVVRIDPLAGGDGFEAVVARLDHVHDLAVLQSATALAAVCGALTPTEQIEVGAPVLVTGHAMVDDPGHVFRWLDAPGTWAGGTTRDEAVPLGRVSSSDVMPGMSGAPVIRTGDGAVVGVVSGRYNSADGWLAGTVWVARTEDLLPLMDGLPGGAGFLLRAVPFGQPLTGHTFTVWWGAWASVAGQLVLATGGDDRTVRLWEVVEDRPVPRLPAYRSDAAAAADELSRAGDAVALAELVTAVSARPPLAVGLFGDWGEGKSHFLELLQQQVAAVARPDNLLAHSAVRQVRFNAWHYAETDLWASLVAELFAQLAQVPDGQRGAEQRSQSRLAADLIWQRGLAERLTAARDRRDDLQQAVHKAQREDLGSWEALSTEQRQQLELLIGGRAEKLYRDAVRTAASLRESGRLSWRLARTLRPATWARLTLAFAVVVAAAVALGWAVPHLLRWSVIASAAAAVLTVGELWRKARAETAKRATPAWKAAVRMGEAQRQRLQNAADLAAAEVTALEREVQNLTAAGQLAGIVTDRAGSADYRSRLGVMTQIREDFTRMAALLTGTAGPAGDNVPDRMAASHKDGPATDAAGDLLPRIDRIIVYIDDLDRCPPRRVVEMLEAIHLLLAVPLFVVVVAVDPRWLLRAIAAHYRDLLQLPVAPTGQASAVVSVDPDDEELWNSTPAQYLEKIFQVVLTLPPLDRGGYQRMLRTMVGTRKDQIPPAPTAAAATAVGPLPDSASPGEQPSVDVAEPWSDTAIFGARLPAARVVERVDPLTLQPAELALLDLLGPPLLVATPRAVKRLANSYGLLTALRRDHRAADLQNQHVSITVPATGETRDHVYYPYRGGMVLLAALIAFPALGPALFLHLHHTAAANPHQSWEDFLGCLQPARGPGGWANPADPSMTPVQAQQWQALLDGLHHVSHAAASNDLPLPEPLTAWHPWVVPVGRLSFPTGRIISSLDRQRPLPDTSTSGSSTGCRSQQDLS